MIEARIGPLGTGRIILDGKDIGDSTSGIDIENRVGEPTRVTLHLAAQDITDLVLTDEQVAYNIAAPVRALLDDIEQMGESSVVLRSLDSFKALRTLLP